VSNQSGVGRHSASLYDNGYSIRCVYDPVPPAPISVSPSTISLTGSAYTPTQQPGEIVTVTSTGSWTLTSDVPWMRLTLNANGSGSGASVTGWGNSTVYLVVEGNPSTTDSRIANIAQAGSVKVIVTQAPYVYGGFAERITWDSEAYGGTGTYVLTGNYTDAGLYFKYGSVVGIFSGNGDFNQTLPGSNTSSFVASTHVAWSPVTTTGWSWNNVPYAPDMSINTVYHTVDNVQSGTGDPCRLVGLNLDYIKNTPATSLTLDDIDNKLWRLPTAADNTAFTSGVSGSHWWGAVGTTYQSPFSLVPGGEFPNRNSGSGDTPNPSKFLPANGQRNASGTAEIIGVQGRYWGSTPTPPNVTYPNHSYGLGFNSGSASWNQPYDYKLGFGIRCVRQ